MKTSLLACFETREEKWKAKDKIDPRSCIGRVGEVILIDEIHKQETSPI